jgi:hypothetical protein
MRTIRWGAVAGMVVALGGGCSSSDAGAPAAAGVNLVADVPTDVAGAARPPAGPFDIGAFQSR